MNKKIMLSILIIILLLNGVGYGASEIDGVRSETLIGEVLEIGELIPLGEETFDGQVQEIKILIKSGDKKGEELILDNTLSDNQSYNLNFDVGDKVTVIHETTEDSDYENIYISDHYRVNHLMVLIGFFIFIVILIGRGKGVRAIISLGFTILSIVFVVLPLILKGYNPVVVSVIVAIVITFVTILLITGFTVKSLAATVGTSLGVLIAGIIASIVGGQIKLTGLSADDATMLMFLPNGLEFDYSRLKQLLFAGIILGALGAVMDVGMSVASSLDEIYKANNKLTRKELFTAGLNVGRDVMGTMVNTLVLAYTGTSIPSLLLFMAYDSSMVDVLNLDLIATEVVRSMSGSIGLVLTIPVTAFISAIMLKRGENKEEEGKIVEDKELDLGGKELEVGDDELD